MRPFLRYVTVGIVVLSLLATSVFISSSLSAASGRVVINGVTTANCSLPGSSFDNQTVPASSQTGRISVGLENFGAPDEVGLWLTFPDGRVYDVLSVYDLDGLYDFVVDNETRYRMPFGEGAFGYLLTPQMPVGCHRLTVHSFARNQDVIVPFVVLAGGSPANGPVTLDVHPSAITQQQRTVSLEMRGFLVNEDIAVWLTQPNGVVVDLGYFPNAGPNFDIRPFYIDPILPVGRHYVTAYGVRSGYIAITPLDVQIGSGGSPSRYTRIDVWLTRDTQRSTFIVSGSGFGATGESFGSMENVSFWLTYPNGKVLGLGSVDTDDRGVFEATLYMSEQFPVGKYFITGRGNRTGQLAIATFTLTEGDVNSGMYSVRSEPVDPASMNAEQSSADEQLVETPVPTAVPPTAEPAPVEVAPPIQDAPIEAAPPVEAAPTEPAPVADEPTFEPAPPVDVPPTEAPAVEAPPADTPPPADAPPLDLPPLIDDGSGNPAPAPIIQP